MEMLMIPVKFALEVCHQFVDFFKLFQTNVSTRFTLSTRIWCLAMATVLPVTSGDVSRTPKNVINTNNYATRKTISQGMLDVALLTANASQLKYSLQLGDKNKFYYVLVTLILLSIVFQVLVGIIFIFVGYINLDDPDRQKRLNRLNNVCTILIFIITVINVFIAGFGISTEATPI